VHPEEIQRIENNAASKIMQHPEMQIWDNAASGNARKNAAS
jgi:hypothetical protein